MLLENSAVHSFSLYLQVLRAEQLGADCSLLQIRSGYRLVHGGMLFGGSLEWLDAGTFQRHP